MGVDYFTCDDCKCTLHDHMCDDGTDYSHLKIISPLDPKGKEMTFCNDCLGSKIVNNLDYVANDEPGLEEVLTFENWERIFKQKDLRFSTWRYSIGDIAAQIECKLAKIKLLHKEVDKLVDWLSKNTPDVSKKRKREEDSENDDSKTFREDPIADGCDNKRFKQEECATNEVSLD